MIAAASYVVFQHQSGRYPFYLQRHLRNRLTFKRFRKNAFNVMGKCECGRLKGNPCGPLRPNTINVTMPTAKTVAYLRGRDPVAGRSQPAPLYPRVRAKARLPHRQLHRGDRLVVSELSRLGRSLGVSRLNGKEDDIRRFLKLGVSKTAITKITGVSRPTRYSSMSTRGLRTNP